MGINIIIILDEVLEFCYTENYVKMELISLLI